jgi:hypothetical protein
MARIGNKNLLKKYKEYSDSVEDWRQTARKAVKGSHLELYQFGSPKARQRTQIFKYGPLDVVKGETVLYFSGAIAATPLAHIEVKQISLIVSGALSSSNSFHATSRPNLFVDKVGIKGRNLSLTHDPDYFYTGSTEHYRENTTYTYVSASGDALLAGQARAGHGSYDASHIYRGGIFTASADISVTFNKSPGAMPEATFDNSGSLYLFVYAEKCWKAWD